METIESWKAEGKKRARRRERELPVTLPGPFVFARCAGTFDQIVGFREALDDSSIHRRSNEFFSNDCFPSSFDISKR